MIVLRDENASYTSSNASEELRVAVGYVGIGMTTVPLTYSNIENWILAVYDISYREAREADCPLQVTRCVTC